MEPNPEASAPVTSQAGQRRSAMAAPDPSTAETTPEHEEASVAAPEQHLDRAHVVCFDLVGSEDARPNYDDRLATLAEVVSAELEDIGTVADPLWTDISGDAVTLVVAGDFPASTLAERVQSGLNDRNDALRVGIGIATGAVVLKNVTIAGTDHAAAFGPPIDYATRGARLARFTSDQTRIVALRGKFAAPYEEPAVTLDGQGHAFHVEKVGGRLANLDVVAEYVVAIRALTDEHFQSALLTAVESAVALPVAMGAASSEPAAFELAYRFWKEESKWLEWGLVAFLASWRPAELRGERADSRDLESPLEKLLESSLEEFRAHLDAFSSGFDALSSHREKVADTSGNPAATVWFANGGGNSFEHVAAECLEFLTALQAIPSAAAAVAKNLEMAPGVSPRLVRILTAGMPLPARQWR